MWRRAVCPSESPHPSHAPLLCGTGGLGNVDPKPLQSNPLLSGQSPTLWESITSRRKFPKSHRRYNLGNKLNRLTKSFDNWGQRQAPGCIVTTGTTASLDIPDDSVDYIFTDPPFGENIYYADLNFLVESWHRVLTNAAPEAIVDRFKKKGSSRVPTPDAALFRGVPARSQAGPMDDGRLPQLQERGVDGNPGSHACRRLRGRRCAHDGQAAGLVPSGHQYRGQAGSRHLGLQAERGAGGALRAHERRRGGGMGLPSYPSRTSARVSSPGTGASRSSTSANPTCSSIA